MKLVSTWLGAVVFCLAASATLSPGQAAGLSGELRTWAVYYGRMVGPAVLTRFDLVVLDPDGHPPLVRAAPRRPLYLGYVSLGEAEPQRPYFDSIKAAAWLIRKNENWGSWVVDVRSPQWRSLLLGRIIPAVLAQGFDGLFMDTLDSPLEEQRRDPERFAGMAEAMVDLIRAVRSAFPQAIICLNRGSELWPKAAPYIDAVLMEDFSTFYDFERSAYLLQDERVVEAHLRKAAELRRLAPRVRVLTLDYVAPGDWAAAKKAIDRARRAGLTPYVSDIDLDEVYLYTLDR